MEVKETTREKSGVKNWPVHHHVKVGEVCVFDKKFSMSGFKYNAICLREDGALVMFDHDRCGTLPKEEEEINANT